MAYMIYINVDAEHDFYDGVLGSEEARNALPYLRKRAVMYRKNGDIYITTQDTHDDSYFDTVEGKNLPIIHTKIGTWGWQIDEEIINTMAGYENYHNFIKYTFGSTDLIEFLKTIIKPEEQSKWTITFGGYCIDICVISNILMVKAHFPEANIRADMNALAGSSPEAYDAASIVLKNCHIELYYED